MSLPITLEGMKSEADKRRDDMVSGLSADDRRAWDRLSDGGCLKDSDRVEREILNKLPVGLQKKLEAEEGSELTPEEKGRLDIAVRQVTSEHIDRCLRERNMSEVGRKRVSRFFLAERSD